MRHPTLALLAGLALCAAAPGAPVRAQSDAPRFDPVFTDHMVLQHGEPVAVWGEAAPGTPVTLTVDGRQASAETDAAGRWQAELPALEPGGPYTLTVASGDGPGHSLSDILAGDVWLCSGQSNMDYPVYRALNPDSEIDGATDDGIRLLTIAKANAPGPLADHADAQDWQLLSPEAVRDFSAVCYFFGREMRARRGDVPVGLINASWGGSRIEAWMGADSLRSAGGFDTQLDLLETYAADPDAANTRFGEQWERWWLETSGGTRPWAENAGNESWSAVPELGDWRAWPDPGMATHLGMVWYRNALTLSEAQADAGATLVLGGIDEVDSVWVNGHFIGSTFGWGTARRYVLPAGILQAGENTVTVNVLNTWSAGGLIGPADTIALELDGMDAVPLGDDWQYRRVPPEYGSPPRTPWESIGGLAGLHNAMIAPLGPFGLRGAIWYQGESNTGRADAYEGLLAGLIAGWRTQFGSDLPALIVQLPGFGGLQEGPAASGWAELRDAQRRVAAADPATGLVVTIDVGDRYDIHPPNKLAVARRAAIAADAMLFDGDQSVWGARPVAALASGDEVSITFDAPDGPLRVIGSGSPSSFEICGPDGRCAYAVATVEDDTVTLRRHNADAAHTVRYCWADAPICNLFNADDRPVGPFEIEITAD